MDVETRSVPDPAPADPVAPPRGGRYHGFDLLRIVAALGVVLTHSFSTTGHSADKPILNVGDVPVGAGRLGVAVFFVISGFLVTESWHRTRRAGRFLVRRATRIWPALLLMVVLTTFVVGPIQTTLSAHDYFTHRQTWNFAWRNSTLLAGPSFMLPGVFVDNPGRPVNSSIWTLPYEVWCYLGLVLLGAVGVLRSRWVVLTLFLGVVALQVYGTMGADPWLSAHAHGISARKAAELGGLFLGGAAVACWRDRVDRRLMLGGGLALVALSLVAGRWGLFVLGVPPLIVALGTTAGSVARAVGRFGDPSYGVYILSYPMQQCLVAAGVVTTSWAMFAVAAPLALVLGYVSWHLVEKRALARLKRSPAPAPTPQPAVA